MPERIDELDLVIMKLHGERKENVKLQSALLALEARAHAKMVREKYNIEPGDSFLADGTIQRAPKK